MFSNTFASIQQAQKAKRESKRSPNPSSFYYKKNYWWTKELQQLHCNLSSLSPLDPNYSSERLAYKQAVHKTKNDHFKKIIEKCSDEEIWSLRSWCTKPRKNQFFPSISFSTGPATTSPEIATGFFNEFFFPPKISPVYSSLALDPPPLEPRDFHPITSEEISQALKSTSNSSAPGLSQISYKFIKFSFPHISSFLLSLFNSLFLFSYHPLLWKSALMVVISKPRKADYSSPCLYRPISLLECFLKLLEKIIANRILYDSILYYIIPANQFGGKLFSSTADAGVSLISHINKIKKKHPTHLLSLL